MHSLDNQVTSLTTGGGITELSASLGLLFFIHQTEISNFQFPPQIEDDY